MSGTSETIAGAIVGIGATIFYGLVMTVMAGFLLGLVLAVL